MMSELDSWWVHTVQVATYLGAGSAGDQYAAPVAKAAWVEDVQKLVRDTKSGEETVSSSTVCGPLSDSAVYLPGSLVTLPSGRTARVLSLGYLDSGGLGGLDHIEVSLT